jgi:hypothetical protein
VALAKIILPYYATHMIVIYIKLLLYDVDNLWVIEEKLEALEVERPILFKLIK